MDYNETNHRKGNAMFPFTFVFTYIAPFDPTKSSTISNSFDWKELTTTKKWIVTCFLAHFYKKGILAKTGRYQLVIYRKRIKTHATLIRLD